MIWYRISYQTLTLKFKNRCKIGVKIGVNPKNFTPINSSKCLVLLHLFSDKIEYGGDGEN